MKLLTWMICGAFIGAGALLTGTFWAQNLTRAVVSNLGLIAVKKAATTKPLPGTIGKIIPGFVKGDPLRLSPSFSGSLCYSFDSIQQPDDHFLVVRRGNEATTFKMATKDAEVLEPQFSPDGRFVAFRVSFPEENTPDYVNSTLYVLDILHRQVRQVSSRTINFPLTLWSRDGRFLAFVEGGNVDGFPSPYNENPPPLALIVSDWKSGREWVIAQNDGVKEGFNWGEGDELFFSARTKDGRNSIYKAKLGGAKTLVVRDALAPIVSPSSRKIAFLRPTGINGRRAAIYLANTDGTRRHFLRTQPTADVYYRPFWAWSRDESRLFLVETGASPQRGTVSSIDTQSGIARRVGQFRSTAFEGDSPDFLNLREENGFLMCDVNSITGTLNENFCSASQTLQSLDAKGQLRVWATSTGSSTLAWHSSDAD